MFHDDTEPLEPEYTSLEPAEESRRFDGSYETGSTVPPQRGGGYVAAGLLIFVLICGLFGGMLIDLMLPEKEIPEETAETDALLSAEALMSDEYPLPTEMPEGLPPSRADSGTKLTISDTPEAVPNQPQTGGLPLQEVYRKVSPSTVSITASTGSGTATGSGIIMSASGYIITNCHVVSGGTLLTVILDDGREFPAQLVGKDNLSDLAVLSIDAPDLIPAEFGDSDMVQVGDAVTAIGDPLGIELRGTMTNGIVSAINRNLTIQGRSLTLIQTNAALNEGNSGGPLINCYGQVIGINTAKMGDYYSSAGVEGLGFAIPINLAKEVVDQLISLGYVPGRPSLGVETTVLSYEYQMWFSLPEGLYITAVEEDSSAWNTGLREGDVITHVNGQRVTSEANLTTALGDFSPGDTVSIVIYRKHRQYEGSLILGEAGE